MPGLRHASLAGGIVMTLALCAKAAVGTLSFGVRPVVNGAPLEPDAPVYANAAGEVFSVGRASFLLTDFALEQVDGGWVEIPNSVAWMDASSKRLSTLFVGGTLTGRYRSVRFHVGPNPAQNAADVTKLPASDPLNPNVNGLHWSWQGGYIFLALEGMTRQGSNEFKGWSYHLARDPNRTTVVIPAEMDLAKPVSVVVNFDPGRLLNAPRSISFVRDGSATHSRDGDPIAAALVANLPGAFSLHRLAPLTETAKTPTPLPVLYLPATYTPFSFKMPAAFPLPELPRDNPLLAERVSLGEKLFHETALSRDGTISCASCHDATRAFADPRRFSVGVEGRTGTRNAMPLQNLAWKSSFFWDGRAPSLRAQALMPMQDHAEMDESLTNVVAKLSARADYRDAFAAAFAPPDITPEKIGLAIETYVLTLTSFDAKFDRAIRGAAKLSDEEKRGFELFMTEFEPRTGQFGGDCFHCHGGALFTDHQFHNNGLDADVTQTLLSAQNATTRTGVSAVPDPGREKITGRAADRGKFVTPTLRNVALTAPYMHDGRFQTLEDVVNHYRRGVRRSATLDPNLAKHPVGGVPLSDADTAALVAFLRTLTEERKP